MSNLTKRKRQNDNLFKISQHKLIKKAGPNRVENKNAGHRLQVQKQNVGQK